MSLPDSSVDDDRLPVPHWARVAFAARCARTVLPLFTSRWTAAPERYQAAVVAAVEAAEYSAAKACPHPELLRFSIDSVAAAGAAYCAEQRLSIKGVAPARSAGDNPIQAGFAARAANMAAEAALAAIDKSAQPAFEAYSFASDAAEGADDLFDQMQDDLERLVAKSRDAGWGDETPVPTTLFDELAKSESIFTRLWRRFR